MRFVFIGLAILFVYLLHGDSESARNEKHSQERLSVTDEVRSTAGLIPHRILRVESTPPYVYSTDVEVTLIEGRLPTVTEMVLLSEHIVAESMNFHTKYIYYYLPGMKRSGGAFATANYQPELELKRYGLPLLVHPDYAKFVDKNVYKVRD